MLIVQRLKVENISFCSQIQNVLSPDCVYKSVTGFLVSDKKYFIKGKTGSRKEHLHMFLDFHLNYVS